MNTWDLLACICIALAMVNSFAFHFSPVEGSVALLGLGNILHILYSHEVKK